MYPGIEDSVLYETNLNHLKDADRNEIKSIFDKLKSTKNPDLRMQGIRKLMELIKHTNITNLEEFKCYLILSCKIFLLKNLSILFRTSLTEPLNNIFLKISPLWVYDPIILHSIALNLYEFLQNDENLIHLTKNIYFYNYFSYYIGLALIWAAFCNLAKIDIKYFRLYDLTKFLEVLKNCEISDFLQNINSLETFIKLYVLFQNVFICNKHFNKHELYNRFFNKNPQQIQQIFEYFNNLRLMLDTANNINAFIHSVKNLDNRELKKGMLKNIITLNILPKLQQDSSQSTCGINKL